MLVDFDDLLDLRVLFLEVFGGHDGLAVEKDVAAGDQVFASPVAVRYSECSLFDVDRAVEGDGFCGGFSFEADELDGAEDGNLRAE